ncbi:MAG: hypothetical protein WC451_03775 [Patescibacteria group bacterium]
MKKLFVFITVAALMIIMMPAKAFAAGFSVSGGGSKTVGQNFSISVVASGASFDTVSGSISISGPVSVISVSAGNADVWMTRPSANGSFSGAVLGRTVGSLTVATITLRGTSIGSGSVSASGQLLASGGVVGSGAGSASFSIAKAADLPGAVTVTSSSHPDPAAAYEATTIALAWNKASGVDGFSYLLDQAETTVPPAKATNDLTSVSYPDKAIGTYFFHIRAHKPDGWGTTTHFKINIKEPDAKIDPNLEKPSGIKIEKAENFVNNIKDGLVTGIVILGKTELGFTANATLTPTPALPEGKKYNVLVAENGDFSIPIDWPIPAGRYTLTVQGQKEKILTPVSDTIIFEISQAKGGNINILTDDDESPPKSIVDTVSAKGFNWKLISSIVAGILVIALIVVLIVMRRKKYHL